MWAVFPRSGGNLALLGTPLCSGVEFDSSAWAMLRWRTPARYAAVAVLLPACVVHVAAVRLSREQAGRRFARVAAAGVLLVRGSGALPLGVDVGADAACRSRLDVFWRGIADFLAGDLALALAAVCALLAVRVPGHRMRRFVRRPGFRRAVSGLGAGALLCFLPVTDVAAGPGTGGDACREAPRRGERAFLCNARTAFPTMPDHLLLAYGRRQCAAYPDIAVHVSLILPICPAAARDSDREIAAQEAESERQEAASRATCDRSRHRPMLKPVGVARGTQREHQLLRFHRGRHRRRAGPARTHGVPALARARHPVLTRKGPSGQTGDEARSTGHLLGG